MGPNTQSNQYSTRRAQHGKPALLPKDAKTTKISCPAFSSLHTNVLLNPFDLEKYTGIYKKNENDFDIFTTLTNSLGYLKSSFVFTQAAQNCKKLLYLKLDLGWP